MKKIALILLAFTALVASACTKPLANASITRNLEFMSRSYAANANDIYYASKWALEESGYPISGENLKDGILTTTWLPVKSSSHYINVFDRPDYGVTNSYYQLEIQVVPEGGRTEVRIAARTKSLVSNLKSSGTEERKVLDLIGGYLRKDEPTVTNLGIDE
jgi:hypothetical protein